MKYKANQRFPLSADDKVFLPKTLKGIQFYRCHCYFLLLLLQSKRSQKGRAHPVKRWKLKNDCNFILLLWSNIAHLDAGQPISMWMRFVVQRKNEMRKQSNGKWFNQPLIRSFHVTYAIAAPNSVKLKAKWRVQMNIERYDHAFNAVCVC